MNRLLIVLLLAAACRRQEVEPPAPPPFPAKSMAPYVAAIGDSFFISYLDTAAGTLNLAEWNDGKWSAPRPIASGKLLMNRADHPTLVADGKALLASWPERNEHGSVIHLARSEDRGATWRSLGTPHPKVVSQFGFVSLSAPAIVWLDGRKLKGGMEGEGEMELRAVMRDGSQMLLDPRVCDCCQTAMAVTSDGPIVAYRDHGMDGTRDISVVRHAGKWTEPKALHTDGWKIPGCPVNGPQLAADGREVVAAWFTGANEQPRVQVAFSRDAGATFGDPIRVDLGKPAGRVDVGLLRDGSAVVTWIEGTSLQIRRVERDGKLDPPRRIADAVSGFPRIAVSKQNVGVAWSDASSVQFTCEKF